MDNKNERTDIAWIHALKQDDREAIDDLWEHLYVRAAKIEKKDEDIRSEAAEAAHSRIMKNGIYRYAFKGKFLGFCYRTLVNEINRCWQKHKKPFEYDIADFDNKIPIEQDFKLTTDSQTIQARLKPCLDRLTNRERKVIQLRYEELLTPAQVAEALSISRGNTNKIAHEVRKKIKQCLHDHGYMSSDDVLST